MSSSREAFENDFCPVQESLLGEMYRANEHGLPQLVASVAPDVRAMLALFCYRRSHLHSLAVAIAASCTQRDLIQLGGRVGSALYALAQEGPRAAQPIGYGHRKPITLSTRPLSAIAPMQDDDLDNDVTDDDDDAVLELIEDVAPTAAEIFPEPLPAPAVSHLRLVVS